MKPSAPQIGYDAVTNFKKDDVIDVDSSSSPTTAFHTANQAPSLYPSLSNTNQRYEVNDQPLEVSRKRRSTTVSSSEGKKAHIATTPTKVQQSPRSWFSQFLRK